MATSLVAVVKAALSATYANSLEFGSVEQKLQYNVSKPFAEGIGADQAQKLWTDQRTIAASGSETLDLSGVLTDVFGAALSLTKVKALLIKAAESNVNDVVVGNAATNTWLGAFGAAAHTMAVKPGGALLLIAPDANGLAVIAGTGDQLKIANSGAGSSVSFDIVVIGI